MIFWYNGLISWLDGVGLCKNSYIYIEKLKQIWKTSLSWNWRLMAWLHLPTHPSLTTGKSAARPLFAVIAKVHHPSNKSTLEPWTIWQACLTNLMATASSGNQLRKTSLYEFQWQCKTIQADLFTICRQRFDLKMRTSSWNSFALHSHIQWCLENAKKLFCRHHTRRYYTLTLRETDEMFSTHHHSRHQHLLLVAQHQRHLVGREHLRNSKANKLKIN